MNPSNIDAFLGETAEVVLQRHPNNSLKTASLITKGLLLEQEIIKLQHQRVDLAAQITHWSNMLDEANERRDQLAPSPATTFLNQSEMARNAVDGAQSRLNRATAKDATAE